VKRWLLDTDHFTLFERGDATLAARMTAASADVFGLAAVTLEEALRGRLSHLSKASDSVQRITRYRFLVGTFVALQRFEIVAYDQVAESAYLSLRSSYRRVGTQDSKIAATAISHGWTLLTRNTSDFGAISGLQLDDWSRP
jgi:predicted nucleic acid-binding protein